MLRQLLTENLLLSLMGGAIGVLLATWMVGLVRFFIPNSYLPLSFSVSLDSRILGWTLLLTLLTGVLFGFVPALQASRPRLNVALKDGGRSSAFGTFRHRLLGLFVVSQVALALVLLVCAGLCLKGLRRYASPGELPLRCEPFRRGDLRRRSRSARLHRAGRLLDAGPSCRPS